MSDVVIVGAGTSGSVLAGRLSEDADRRVLVLEAGAAPGAADRYPTEIRQVSGDPASMPGHPSNWAFEAELLAGRPWTIPRGRIVGGSSAINGAYFVRGVPRDFDDWAASGNDGWSYADVLPYFRRLETDHDFGGACHGSDGPVPVRRPFGALLSPLAEHFLAACDQLGFAAEPDKNAGGAPGAGLVPSNVDGGWRCNAAFSHLLPHLARPNLEVRGDCFVHRVVIERGRAIGVEVENTATAPGQIELVRADEVVLAAGAIKSPHLLMLSGIGPAGDLRSVGIDVVEDLPGVGQDWFDDPIIFVGIRPVRGHRYRPDMVGPQASLHLDTAGDPDGDLELLQLVRPGPDDVVPVAVILQQADSRGRLVLRSSRPDDQPRIEHRYLASDRDRARLRHGVRLCHELVATDAYRSWADDVGGPSGADLADDTRLDEWIRANVSTTAHTAGSARMGDDDGAVVDRHLRVHGIEGLRVVDTSIVPTPLHRGPNATAVMIGERAADLIRHGRAGTTRAGHDA